MSDERARAVESIKSAMTDEEQNKMRAEKLRQAAELVSGVMSTLNGARSRCTCCGIDVLENKSDGRLIQSLAGILEKLGRITGNLDAAVRA